MIIPRIMLAISDPCEETRQTAGQTRRSDWGGGEADKQQFLLIWRSCVTAWRCWSWERSCWSHWLWRTWSPWSHSFWGEKRQNRFVLESLWHLSCSRKFKPYKCFFFYLTGIAGFFLPKFVSKMKPSNAMNINWAKVTMFPHPGNSLKNKATHEAEIRREKI